MQKHREVSGLSSGRRDTCQPGLKCSTVGRFAKQKIPTEVVGGTSGKCNLHSLGVGYLENVTLHFFGGILFWA